jgi:hypothetical protein
MAIGCLLARAGETRRARACQPPNLPPWPVYQYWKLRLNSEIALAEGHASQALALMVEAPPPQIKNLWPEYTVRMALAAGDLEMARSHVSSLVLNPGRYWAQADVTGPGFISWAMGLTDRLMPGSQLFKSAEAFRQTLTQFN